MKDQLRINDRIRVREVRLISQDGEQVGIITIQDALDRAKQAGLDLVEVAPEAKPPVCRIMDYSKLLFDQKKKMKDARKKTKSLEVKEIKLRPKIDDHDFGVKVAHAREFLEKGHKVRVTLMFRGREIAYQDMGHKILEEFVEKTSDIATADWDRKPINPKVMGLNLTKKA